MAFDDPELMAQFVTESREHLGDIDHCLLCRFEVFALDALRELFFREE